MKLKIALLLFILAPSLFAQPLFYSQSLQKLYYSLPPTCRIENPIADTVVFCNEILQNVTVPVAYNLDRFGVLAHLGYRFLPDSVDKHSFHHAIVRFLEREVLALLVTDNLEQKLTNNRENGLTLLHNGNTPRREFYRSKNGLPDVLQNLTGLEIRYDEGNRYHVTLNYGQEQTLTFLFVADAELLSNMDKKERDDRLAAQLSHHQAKNGSIPLHVPACDSASLQLYRDSVYVCPGRFYIIPQINNNLYYLKKCDTTKLIFSLTWASETFSNVMLTSAGRNDYTFRIAHRKYGGEISRYDMKSSDFYDYFSDDYDRYFGIESLDRDKLGGTLILSDRSSGSIHLAFVSVSLWELLNGGVVEMQLDSNIPQHNVETLFGKRKDRDRNDGEKYELKIK